MQKGWQDVPIHFHQQTTELNNCSFQRSSKKLPVDWIWSSFQTCSEMQNMTCPPMQDMISPNFIKQKMHTSLARGCVCRSDPNPLSRLYIHTRGKLLKKCGLMRFEYFAVACKAEPAWLFPSIASPNICSSATIVHNTIQHTWPRGAECQSTCERTDWSIFIENRTLLHAEWYLSGRNSWLTDVVKTTCRLTQELQPAL